MPVTTDVVVFYTSVVLLDSSPTKKGPRDVGPMRAKDDYLRPTRQVPSVDGSRGTET